MSGSVICLVCSDPVRRGGVSCPRCEAPYHKKCYDYNSSKCARFGCVDKPRPTKPTPIPISSHGMTIGRAIRSQGWRDDPGWDIFLAFMKAICFIFIMAGFLGIVVYSTNQSRKAEIEEFQQMLKAQRPIQIEILPHWTERREILSTSGYELFLVKENRHEVWQRKNDP